jgi:hypothetical protein
MTKSAPSRAPRCDVFGVPQPQKCTREHASENQSQPETSASQRARQIRFYKAGIGALICIIGRLRESSGGAQFDGMPTKGQAGLLHPAVTRVLPWAPAFRYVRGTLLCAKNVHHIYVGNMASSNPDARSCNHTDRDRRENKGCNIEPLRSFN